MNISRRRALRLNWILVLLLPTSLLAEPVPFRRVVELAIAHATSAGIAAADEQHAAAGYRELRNNYIPQLATGAGLGYSYGFPLSLEGSAPALFNITAQSALLNPSLRESLRAAKLDSTVASLRAKDQRDQIIQDAAQSYAELAKWEQRLAKLQDTEADATSFRMPSPNGPKRAWTANSTPPRRISLQPVSGSASPKRKVLRMCCESIFPTHWTFSRLHSDGPRFDSRLTRNVGIGRRRRDLRRIQLRQYKLQSSMPGRNICERKQSIARSGPASISPRNMPCCRNSTTFRITTFLRAPA